MPKSEGGLNRWFNEKWVDLSRPKKGGGFEPCGRDDAKSGKYPKCVPEARASRMTPEQIESAIRRKRMAESREKREGKKPIMVETIKKENTPTNPELYARVKAAAKAKFDVYPSAYANAWLVAEYKRRGGKYKVEKGESAGHPFRGNQHTKVSSIGRGTGKALREVNYGKNTPEALTALALGGGFTFDPKRGQLRASGVAVAIKKENEQIVPLEEFAKNGASIIRDYAQKHSEQLAQTNTHIGAWRENIKGKPHIYLDISIRAKTLEEAADLGRKHDQIGIFDLGTFTTWGRVSEGGKYYPQMERRIGGRDMKYLDLTDTSIGKAQKLRGVTFLSASDIENNILIEEFVKTISGSDSISKEDPSSSDTHVPAIMGKVRIKQRRMKRKKERLSDVMTKGEASGHPFRGNQHTKAINAQTKKIVGLIKEKAGEQSAKNFEPVVRSAISVLHNGGRSDEPLRNTEGKKFTIGGKNPTAGEILNMLADEFGSEVVSGMNFGTMIETFKKGDKPLKNPKGGLTQAGRDKYNRETGSNLKRGVTGAADTPEKMRRKGSFLTRFFTNPSGPMVNEKGEPTRLALSAHAWGEPVPKNRSDAAKLAEKGRNLLERYDKTKNG